MSETAIPAADLSGIPLTGRPLIVCDVDEVVLHFLAPFENFLRGAGYKLLPQSFRLTGNIVSVETGAALDAAAVRVLIEAFFEVQEEWQHPVEPVARVLDTLSKEADIVFLTSMPPRYRDHRRRLLDRLGLAFPLIASEAPKGPIMQQLHANRPVPSVFIDDMARNLHSVRDHVSGCLLLHMMPDTPLYRHAPQAEGASPARDWMHAAELIRAHIAPHRP